MTARIIDDFEEREITDDEAKLLVALDLIYFCDEHGWYHLTPDSTWKDVEIEL